MKQKEYRIKGFQTPDRFLLSKLPGIERVDSKSINQDFSQTKNRYFNMVSVNNNSDLKQFILSQMKSKIQINDKFSFMNGQKNATIFPNTQQQRKLSQIVQHQYQQFNNKLEKKGCKAISNSRSSLAIPKLIKNQSLGFIGSNSQLQSSRRELESSSQIERGNEKNYVDNIGKNLEMLSKQKKRINQQLCRNNAQIQNQLKQIEENNREGRQQAISVTKKRVIRNCSKIQPFIDQQKIQQYQLNTSKIDKNSFNLLHVVGRGGFGKVWLVQSKMTKKLYAMKEMSKQQILQKKSVHSVMNERKLLSEVKYGLLVNMVCAFQEQETLYLVMDFKSGGDLRFHIGHKRFFSEQCTKFFACCIIQCLEYLHNKKIIHRDIKPENLVLDDKGYVHITDLGIARYQTPNNSSDTSGTPGYMAPEVLFHKNHTIAVDYFALGVMIYEFMLGRRPYLGKDRKQIRQAVKARQVRITEKELPRTWSKQAADFVNLLLERKQEQRLGFNGPEEVKQHPWIQDFDWEALQKKQILAPFIPNQNTDNFDQKQVNFEEKIYDDDEEYAQNTMLLKTPETQKLFYNYTHESSPNLKCYSQKSTTTAILLNNNNNKKLYQ